MSHILSASITASLCKFKSTKVAFPIDEIWWVHDCHYALHIRVQWTLSLSLVSRKKDFIYFGLGTKHKISMLHDEAHNNGENSCTRSSYSLTFAHSLINFTHKNTSPFSLFFASSTWCHLLWKFSSSRSLSLFLLLSSFPENLPQTTIALLQGWERNIKCLAVASRQDWKFHIPLHYFHPLQTLFCTFTLQLPPL